MHRVKRPSPKAELFGISMVHSRMTHDNPGDEAKAEVPRFRKPRQKYRLNRIGGPLGEDFKSK